jgi:hypothetical protein
MVKLGKGFPINLGLEAKAVKFIINAVERLLNTFS